MPPGDLREGPGLIEIDLAQWPPVLDGVRDRSRVLALIRWGDQPLGILDFDCRAEPLGAQRVWARVNAELGYPVAEAITRHLLRSNPPPTAPDDLPSATVVICTRDRPDDLRRCLASLRERTTISVEVLVVDNAPAKAPAAEVADSFAARCVTEPRPGLNRARATGARAATGDVVIYIDDDVVVCPGWETALLANFRNPEVAGVTGLVLPFTLEAPAQLAFEELCGFSRGYERREHSLSTRSPISAGLVGAGACMAFRRELVTELGIFDVELDAGTPALSGGDTYGFYRLLSLGHILVYDPRVIVRHRHRATMGELRHALYGYSVGTYCYLLRCLLYHRESYALVVGLRWFLEHHVRQLYRRLRRRPNAQPLGLTASEIAGTLAAPFAFARSVARESRR